MAAAAHVVAAAEVGELPAGRGRQQHLAGVRVAQRRLGARAAVRVLVEERASSSPRGGRRPRRVEEQRDIDRGLAVERGREGARVVAVDHRGAVRGGHAGAVDGEPRDLLDVRVAVVGAEDDGVALEELVRPAGRVEERRDRRVGPGERLVRRVRPERVRGVVVVGR